MTDPVDPLLAWRVAAVAAWFAAFFLAERMHPADRRAASGPGGADGRDALSAAPPGSAWRRLGRNGSLWLLTIGVWPVVVSPITAWAVGVPADWRPDWWRGWAGLGLDVLVLDFLIYWWHRANHRIPLLWRFHEVHHLDGTLDTTTAVRFHFGEIVLSALARAAVIVGFGFPLDSVLVFQALVLIAAIFHHSNLALPPGFERALARVIITPSIHWVHHHKRRADTDSNYGTIFSFWDPLFVGARSRS
jgi:sterol desaturase/sphingolipid hydroxylase (fatty acid hydroxylase superfamily)